MMGLLLENFTKSTCKGFVINNVKALVEILICNDQIERITQGHSTRERARVRFLKKCNKNMNDNTSRSLIQKKKAKEKQNKQKLAHEIWSLEPAHQKIINSHIIKPRVKASKYVTKKTEGCKNTLQFAIHRRVIKSTQEPKL